MCWNNLWTDEISYVGNINYRSGTPSVLHPLLKGLGLDRGGLAERVEMMKLVMWGILN